MPLLFALFSPKKLGPCFHHRHQGNVVFVVFFFCFFLVSVVFHTSSSSSSSSPSLLLPLPLLLSDEQRRRKATNEHVHDRVENEAQKRLEVFNANSDDAEKEPRPDRDRSERDESESEENGLDAVQQEGEDVFHDEEVVFIYLVRRRDQNFLFVVFYDF